MEVHPVAALFPMLAEDELKDLAADIKTNGLIHPIIVKEGMLIDGRNRLAACKLAGVEPAFEELNGSDPVTYILSANFARRHMSKGQRAMAAARVFPEETSVRQASIVVGVGYPLISKGRRVLTADPALADQVLAGIVPLNEAYETVQERQKATNRQAKDRATLAELAPDLAEQVSEEVLKLTEALDQARQREQRRKEDQRDAIDLLNRILALVSPDNADDAFIRTWAERIGPVNTSLQAKVRRAGEALLALAERMTT